MQMLITSCLSIDESLLYFVVGLAELLHNFETFILSYR
jgi:hypothetical protein